MSSNQYLDLKPRVERLVRRQSELCNRLIVEARQAIEDHQVGLVRHDQIDVLVAEARSIEHTAAEVLDGIRFALERHPRPAGAEITLEVRSSTADTAGAAREIAEIGDKDVGAIASSLAAKVYGLKVLAKNIEDADHNTTRMLVFSREEAQPDWRTVQCMTAFLFRVKSVPAALYKALGGGWALPDVTAPRTPPSFFSVNTPKSDDE